MMPAWTAEEHLGDRDKRFEDRFKVGSERVDGIRITSTFLALFYTNLCLASHVKFHHTLITLCFFITK